MQKNKITKQILLLIFLFSCSSKNATAVTGNKLNQYKSELLKKIITENKSQEKIIQECLKGIIGDGNPGISLLDKLGIFTYDLRKRGVCINSAKFFYRKTAFYLFIIFEDDYDGQLYNLYLEYEFSRKLSRCYLKDVYFSLVFDEKMKEIKKFFQYR